MEFRKFNGQKVDLVEYVKNYIKEKPKTEIYVGCDSQVEGRNVSYAVIVALYDPGHGAHVIFRGEREKREWFTTKEEANKARLKKEAWKSVEVALYLRENGIETKYVDIDINPDPGQNHQNLSNQVYDETSGLVKGCDFKCRDKGDAPLCTTIADYLARR